MTTNFTTVTTTFTYLCGAEEEGVYCHFEGDATFTLTLNNGTPWGPAEVTCPECGVTQDDQTVSDEYPYGFV